MNRGSMSTPRALPAALLLLAVAAPTGAGPPAGPRLRHPSRYSDTLLAAEIVRLREAASGLVLPDSLAPDARELLAALDRAQADLRKGRAMAALHRLQASAPQVSALRRLAAQDRKDAARFDAEWSRLSSLIPDAKSLMRDDALRRAPAGARAVAEAALNQVRPFYKASRAHADLGHFDGGFYYLGTAEGHLELARFIAGWMGKDPSGAGAAGSPAPRALHPDLEALESETGAAYARPGEATARHAQFIALNATLKQVREMNEEGLRFGALYRYLEGRLRLEAIRDHPAAARADLLALAASTRERLSAEPAGAGIGDLYWEVASGLLENDEAKEEDLRRATIILDTILPACFEITGG